MKKCGIYKIINIINGKIIVGQSINIDRRWHDHKYMLCKNTHNNAYLQSSWSKYGADNFRFEIIIECPINKLDEEEIKYIKIYNSADRRFGYNLDGGGHRQKRVSKETRSKQSKTRTGKHHSEETKKRMSNAKKGNKNYLYKKHLSQEIRDKMSKAHKGKILSDEHRGKISKGNLGKRLGIRLSMATRKKLSKINMGKNNPNFGLTRSEETKRKISEARIGIRFSKEHIKNMANAHRGHIHSEETKRKMSLSHRKIKSNQGLIR